MRVKKRRLGTLFDKNYAAKGYAMLGSLAPAWRAWDWEMIVLALDAWTAEMLACYPPGIPVRVLSLAEFEKGTELPKIREKRSWQEYCWTLASQLAHRMLLMGGVDQVTYLDSDLYFFRPDLSPVFAMIGEASAAAVPHRFDQAHAAYHVNGRYNVSWVTFRNDVEGAAAVARWAMLVREHCSAKNGPRGLGDQGYLDDWPTSLARFRELGHPGMGLGPWSLEDVDVASSPDGPTVDGLPLHFYHFHEFSEGGLGIRLTNYPLTEIEVEAVYRPYIASYIAAKAKIDPDGAKRLEGARWAWRART